MRITIKYRHNVVMVWEVIHWWWLWVAVIGEGSGNNRHMIALFEGRVRLGYKWRNDHKGTTLVLCYGFGKPNVTDINYRHGDVDVHWRKDYAGVYREENEL